MVNSPIDLPIFKYSATDTKGSHINSTFKAESRDDCVLFFDAIGYKNINVIPLKKNSKKKDKKLKISMVSDDFFSLYSSIKGGNNLFTSVALMLKNCSSVNKDVYLRIAYFVYKGNSLSNSMRILGDAIPQDITEEVSKGEASNDLITALGAIIKKYDAKRKKSFSELLFGSKKSQNVADSNLEGLSRREKTQETATLYPFKYKAINELGKKVSGTFDAESTDDCHRFLELQGFKSINIQPRTALDMDIVIGAKIKGADLAFDLTQLSTYIKAGIPLVEGVTILSKQAKNPTTKKVYQKLVYDLLKGYTLSVSMDKQGDAFPPLLINMVRSAEMTGDLPSILDDMADYYEGVEQTKKTMKSAMTYPTLVLVLAIVVFIFMMMYLVPQFITLYENNGAELPGITLMVIGVSGFLQHNIIYIIIGIIVAVLIFYLCYKNIEKFRQAVQIIVMKMPVFGNIVIYNEVYTFTKTFASLINHGVFITDSMEILSKITNNEIYKQIIAKTLANLAKGENISKSFQNEWAFPTVAYHMLVTGENTGQLGLMMEKVSEHYQALHKALVDQLKSLIEPIMILIVAGIVGVILVSIITPMFSIYEQIN